MSRSMRCRCFASSGTWNMAECSRSAHTINQLPPRLLKLRSRTLPQLMTKDATNPINRDSLGPQRADRNVEYLSACCPRSSIYCTLPSPKNSSVPLLPLRSVVTSLPSRALGLLRPTGGSTRGLHCSTSIGSSSGTCSLRTHPRTCAGLCAAWH